MLNNDFKFEKSNLDTQQLSVDAVYTLSAAWLFNRVNHTVDCSRGQLCFDFDECCGLCIHPQRQPVLKLAQRSQLERA